MSATMTNETKGREAETTDPYTLSRQIHAFFDECGGAEAALTMKRCDPKRLQELAEKFNVEINEGDTL
jgi:hypothetical protein